MKKLYGNGQTICIELFFCFFTFFASAGNAAADEGKRAGGLGGYSTASRRAERYYAKRESL